MRSGVDSEAGGGAKAAMKFGQVALGLGALAVTALVVWFGARSIGAEVLLAWTALPPILLIHGVQLWLSSIAWRLVSDGGAVPDRLTWLKIRWLREAVNSMLPVAQLGGNLAGIRLLAKAGLPGAKAAAGTTIDLTMEATTQFIFTLAGIAVLMAISTDRSWAPWVEGGLITMGVALAAFIAAQRFGLMRIVEAFAGLLRRVFPGLSMEAVRNLHGELMRLQRNRGALLRSLGLHVAAWLLGVGETWLALAAMGRPVPLAEAMVIESLGMAARSAGFVVPGALGVQEAGFILVGGLFALPPDTCIALSMVKRVRELAVGVPGLLTWQWIEGRELARRG
jgi:putative membrane protein